MYNDGMSLTAPLHPVLTTDVLDVGSFAVSSRTELTLREAANIIGVPKSDLVELLDNGAIEFRTIGNRRVVIADSLYDYDRETTRLQDEALDELTQQTQEWGID